MQEILKKNTTSYPPLGVSSAWVGAYWKLFSCACFAGINGVVRYCSGGTGAEIEALPVPILMFFQNLFGTLLLLPWVLKMGGIETLKTKHPFIHFVRVITAVAGVYLWYLTLQTMPLAEGVALTFTGPIFTIIGAFFLLQERLSLERLLAIILSLTGAFIISRPDIPFRGGNHPIGLAALLPLGSALVLAWNKLLTRRLATRGETPESLAIYLLILMAPVSLIPALYEWTTPTLNQWPWLILLGLLASAAHLSFAKAYKLAEVTFLTPFGFSKFLFSTLVGYIAFAELPTQWTVWLGISVIFLSIVLLAYKRPFAFKNKH